MSQLGPVSFFEELYSLSRNVVVAKSKSSQLRPVTCTEDLQACILNGVIW